MKDIIYLILAAVIVVVSLFGGIYFLSDAGISAEWLLLIGALTAYVIATYYVVMTDKIIKFHKMRYYDYFIIFAIIISPLILAFSLFYFRLIPIPDDLLPYLIF